MADLPDRLPIYATDGRTRGDARCAAARSGRRRSCGRAAAKVKARSSRRARFRRRHQPGNKDLMLARSRGLAGSAGSTVMGLGRAIMTEAGGEGMSLSDLAGEEEGWRQEPYAAAAHDQPDTVDRDPALRGSTSSGVDSCADELVARGPAGGDGALERGEAVARGFDAGEEIGGPALSGSSRAPSRRAEPGSAEAMTMASTERSRPGVGGGQGRCSTPRFRAGLLRRTRPRYLRGRQDRHIIGAVERGIECSTASAVATEATGQASPARAGNIRKRPIAEDEAGSTSALSVCWDGPSIPHHLVAPARYWGRC